MIIDNSVIEEINSGIISKKFIEQLEKAKKNINISRYNTLDDYYLNKSNILYKNRTIKELANNKILNGYAKYITDLNVGYFMGEEVNYNVNDEHVKYLQQLTDLYRNNDIFEVDKSNVKKLSKYGKCYEINYINENSEIKTKSLHPKDVLLFTDGTIEEKVILAVYYSCVDKDNTKLYIYTEKINIIVNIKNNTHNIESIQTNLFSKIPIIEYRNNEECTGDYENILTLIDAYNKIVSNDVDNIEEFIDSILILQGVQGITIEQAKLLREMKMMELTEDGKADYLTKVLDEIGLNQALSRIRQDIHKFSATPDMSDENFIGNSSGVALAYKLLPFELMTNTKQSHYQKGLKQRYELYTIYMNIKNNLPIVPVNEIDIHFKRSLPQNDLEVSQMIANLQGMLTNKTLISRLSFVKDANEEDRLVKEEQEYENEKAMNEINKNTNFNSNLNLDDEEIDEQ